MANSYVTYTGDGTTTTFNVPFSYLFQSEVTCTVSGQTVSFTWPTSSSITLALAPGSGAAIKITRTTNVTNADVVFADGSTVRASDLNLSLQQVLYGLQDAQDQYNAAIQAAIGGSGALPGVNTGNNGSLLVVAGGVWSVKTTAQAGFGTAAFFPTGTSGATIPLNSSLGTAAYLNTGTANSQVALYGSVQRTLFSNSGPSGTLSNIAAQTAFGVNFSLPANTLGTGKLLRIKVGGFVTANAAQSIAIFITCGSISFQSPNFSFASSASGEFWGEMILNCRAAGTSVNCGVIGAINITNPSSVTSAGSAEGGQDATGFNTTIAQTISASFASSVANNSSGLNTLLVEALN